MRKKILVVGLVILLMGVVFFSVGAYSSANEITIKNTWTQYRQGEYISQPLNFSSEYMLLYSYSGQYSGVVTFSNLSKVNESNLRSLSVTPVTNVNSQLVYELGAGSYYIIIFSNSTPNINYEFVKVSTELLIGILTLLGIIMAIAGLIIAIVGAIMKNKRN